MNSKQEVFFNGISRDQLITMLDLQNKLNGVININWVGERFPFLRAAFVEASEAAEHYGWKWWKKQESDIPQVQIEIIDILHFYLSDSIVKANGNIQQAADSVLSDLAGNGEIIFDGVVYAIENLQILELIDLVGGLACAKRKNYMLLGMCMKNVNLTWGSAFSQYVSKNILNIFRQENGYKDGTYIKIWNGKEDNVRLAELMQDLDPENINYASALQDGLAKSYAAVKEMQ